jgi:hypothetical protein
VLRIGAALAAAVLFVAGCASDREAAAPARKVVNVEKIRECTVTINAAAACSAPKNCPQIATCAEAAYRFRTCGHRWLDGDRNGIPCQDKCGRDAKTMAERMAAAPFSPAPQTKRVCRPVR